MFDIFHLVMQNIQPLHVGFILTGMHKGFFGNKVKSCCILEIPKYIKNIAILLKGK